MCLAILSGCTSKVDLQWLPNGGIIKSKGTYQTKNYRIIVREFENGSLVYGVSNNKNKIIFQESILQAFSKNQYWCLFWDKDDNLWAYNSDFNSTDVWLKKAGANAYEKNDFCELGLPLPQEFESELNNFTKVFCP